MGPRLLSLLALLLTTACSTSVLPVSDPQPDGPGPPAAPLLTSATPTPFQPDPAPTAVPAVDAAQPTSLPAAGTGIRIWIDPVLPANLPPNLLQAEDRAQADAWISTRPDRTQNNEGLLVSEWIFALVVPFPTISDEISAEAWDEAWAGNGPEILLSADTYRIWAEMMGRESPAVRVLSAETLLDAAWEARDAWAVVPFTELSPRWKVLAIDGQSPVHKEFDAENYTLRAPFALQGDPGLVEALAALYPPGSSQALVPSGNRDPSRLTTVAMTGVTALVRATAFTMEQQGMRYPARDIASWLQSADILHISNEVPFAEDCPFPNPVQANVVFCSDARYLELLEYIGTDVVELTGDHFHDWGADAMYYTLDLYSEKGWPVYGGGATFDQGKQPVRLEHHGNRFAFIGCNGKGGGFARAGADTPGSVRCDFDWMEGEIERLSSEGILVIASFQHFEYYSYGVPDGMQRDFRRLAQAGAVVVSGSQAHHPHGFQFWEGGLLHFGLGNTFFDQYGISLGTIQAFVDRHVFYDGRHLSTELLTMMFEDFARPRPMTAAERRQLLQSVFSASGW